MGSVDSTVFDSTVFEIVLDCELSDVSMYRVPYVPYSMAQVLSTLKKYLTVEEDLSCQCSRSIFLRGIALR